MSNWQIEYFGSELLTKNGVLSTSDLLKDKKLIGIYFSAHWCPPCRGFTPSLAEFYESLKEEDENSLEIIFASSDRDADSFKLYYDEQPWISIPFTNSDIKQKLSQKYDVRGIPTLIILDGNTGAIKDKDGRTTVSSSHGDTNKVISKWSK